MTTHTIEATDAGARCSCGKTYMRLDSARKHAKRENAAEERAGQAITAEPKGEAAPAQRVAANTAGDIYTHKLRKGTDPREYDIFAPGSDEPLGVASRVVLAEADSGPTVLGWKVTLTDGRTGQGKFRNRVIAEIFATDA